MKILFYCIFVINKLLNVRNALFLNGLNMFGNKKQKMASNYINFFPSHNNGDLMIELFQIELK